MHERAYCTRRMRQGVFAMFAAKVGLWNMNPLS
jgi:hypothetical protein